MKLNPMLHSGTTGNPNLELPEMNVQMPLQNTNHAMETASQLKEPSALQTLVAIPSLIIAG